MFSLIILNFYRLVNALVNFRSVNAITLNNTKHSVYKLFIKGKVSLSSRIFELLRSRNTAK